ncbi:MAG: hypothetical protein LC768_09810 [Acidobacteria bacterium]|nr:hypothetical protein [Acidobacteriota bacterium]MCA1638612.1 hypothetical protein [Acidobacteriota bacterium]
MVIKEYTDEEIEELDDFLQFEFYYEIYQELTNKDGKNFELFEPLECCRVISLAVKQIEESKAKPLTVSRHLKKELNLLYGEKPLTDKQRYFLYEYILDYFVNVRREDKQIEICCSEILKLQQNLEVYEDDEDVTNDPEQILFDFKEVLKHLETFSTYKEKITYLIQRKTDYEQNRMLLDDAWGTPFHEKCQLEIEKLEKLAMLEATQIESKNSIKKHKDLTLDRAVLAMSYLLDELNVKCPLSKKKEFIAFLTPFSPNTIKTKLENLHEKQEKNFVEYEKDLETISKYFENLGLVKIVEQIKEDLEFE